MSEPAFLAFFAARLDEEEAAARHYLTRYVDGEWARVVCDPIIGAFGGQTANRDIATGMYVAAMSDPARVLREVHAKRAILTAYEDALGTSELFKRELGTGTHMVVAAESYLYVIRALSAVYSDHPDYDPAWSGNQERPGERGQPGGDEPVRAS